MAPALDDVYREECDSDASVHQAKVMLVRAKIRLGLLPPIGAPASSTSSSSTGAAAKALAGNEDVPTLASIPSCNAPDVASTVVSESVLGAWLQEDLLSLRPEASRLVQGLFATLDRGSKGHLSPEELAWITSIHPRQHVRLNAALGVIERRVGGDQENLEHIRANMHMQRLSPDVVRAVQWPSDAFFSCFTSSSDALRLTRIAPHLLLQPNWGALSLQPAVPRQGVPLATRTSEPVAALQRDLFQRYFALHAQSFHRAYFPPLTSTTAAAGPSSPSADGYCTRDRFESYIARELLLRPALTASWLGAAVLVLEGAHAHPTLELLRAHQQGRQGYKGRAVLQQRQ